MDMTKEQKKQLNNLKFIHNQILTSFSFRNKRTWEEVYQQQGLKSGPKSGALTYKELKDYLQKEHDELESKFEIESTGNGANIKVEDKDNQDNRIRSESESITTVSSPKETRIETPIRSEPNNTSSEVLAAPNIFTPDNDYGFIPSPNEDVHFFWFQKKAIAELNQKLIVENKSGVLLRAGTGTGKTFITYGVLRRMLDSKYHEDRTFSHIPYLVLSKSTILTQHDRVARNFFHITTEDTEITNIETLRAKAGQLWIKESLDIVGGEEVEVYEWKKKINPCVIFLDESQGAKRKQAKQTKIILKYSELPSDQAKLVCISATPFMRVSEAQAFAVSTHRPLEHLGFPAGTLLTNETWPAYASIIASPSSPTDYNEAAVDRLMRDLEPWVVQVKNVRPQFEADNRVRTVQFESLEKRRFYESAMERFEAEKAKLDNAKLAGDVSSVCYLVVLLKFAMAAELCHADMFAAEMYHDIQEGFAACCAVKFKQTLIAVVKILIEKYKVPRDKISLIWGGGQTQLTKKQKAKAKIKKMEEKLKEMGISVEEMLGDTGLDEVEDRVIEDLPEEYRLGAQSLDERQKEIDRFQSGKSLYCIYILKAGGVGLSLHHSDELTTRWDDTVAGYSDWIKDIEKWNSNKPKHLQVKPGKCRRKPSGYAFEEDIKFIPVRPRTNRVTVTYNAVELVQGVGRVPRLTSLSRTQQFIDCYAGTVEVEMGRVYSKKLRCLSAVVRQHEDWQSIIFGGSNASKYADTLIQASEALEKDESTLIDEGDSEEGDEDENDS